MSGPTRRLRIELLYVDDCPSYRQVWNDLLEVIHDARLDATVRPVRIDSQEKADELRFAGSPTVKVNGRDLEGYDGPGAMACRVYRENGNRGWPSRSLLQRAVSAAAQAT